MHGFATVLYMRSWTIGIVIGVFSASLLPQLLSWWWIAVFTAASFGLLLWRGGSVNSFLLFAVLGFAFGSFQGGSLIEKRLPKALEGQWLDVEGYISDVPVLINSTRGKRQRFAFVVTAVDCGSYDVNCPTKLGKLRLSHYGAGEFLPAQAWRFKVKLKRPRGMVNPGTFDYQAWLIGEGFAATGYVKEGTESRLNRVPPWYYYIYQWRLALADNIYSNVEDQRLASMIVALTTGLRHYLSRDDRQLFQKLGISHLMVISGLHVGMVAGVAYLLFMFMGRFIVLVYPLLPAQFWGLLGSFLSATLYALMAGFSLPTQRALIMLGFVQFGLLNSKKRRGLDALAIALVAVALMQPLALHSPSFWLSFFAVVTIFFLLWASPFNPVDDNQKSVKFKSWLWVQMGICILMLPLTLFWFSGASLIAPLANAIAIPLVSLWVVPLSLFAIPWLNLAPGLAQLCWQLAAFGLYWLIEICRQVNKSISMVWVDSYVATSTLLLLIIVALWLYFMPLKRLKLPALVLLMPLAFPLIDRPEYGDIRLTVLDVGQGLAIVVETKEHTVVYDTGPGFDSGFNTGHAVLWPFLLYRHIHFVDLLIVSHGDNDHAGGAESLLDLLPVEAVYSGEPDSLAIDAKACHSQQAWLWDGVQFEILHPAPNQVIRRANNRSCVLKITAGEFVVLIPGDIGRKVESALLANLDKTALNAHLLLVPHHGSNTSSSPEFLSAVDPSMAVISAGYLNRYRHPRDEVIERLRTFDMQILNTANSGAISFKVVDGKVGEITEHRLQKAYFWYH